VKLPQLARHAVVRNALLMYAVQFSGYLIPMITLPYLWRVLSPERFGSIAFAQSLTWYFIVLTEYGFNLTATRQAARLGDDREALGRLYGAVTWAKILLTVLGSAVYAVIVAAVPRFRAEWGLFAVTYLTVIGYMLFPMWLYQGMQKMQHVAARDLLAKLIALAALFALVRDDGDYLLAAAVQSGGFLLAGLVGLLTVPRSLKVDIRWPDRTGIEQALRDGWPVFLSMAASTLLTNTNIFLLGLWSTGTEVGYLAAAQRIIAAFRALVGPLSTAIYPHVSEKASRSEPEAAHFIRKYAPILTAPFAAAGIAMLIGAPLATRLLLGDTGKPVAPLLQIMAFSPAMLALSHMYSTFYMLACGHDRQWMRIMVLSVGVNFLILIPLISLVRGSVAMAIAFTVVDVFCMLSYFRFFRRHASR
jgi:PST family polysaccharide transporter